MNPYLYAALCVIVPLVWGVVVVQVSNRIDAAVARRRRASGKHDDSLPPTEYYI
jgi:hypothetical protein